jgi:hypothetical protein
MKIEESRPVVESRPTAGCASALTQLLSWLEHSLSRYEGLETKHAEIILSCLCLNLC